MIVIVVGSAARLFMNDRRPRVIQILPRRESEEGPVVRLRVRLIVLAFAFSAPIMTDVNGGPN
jgi:uncharacterized membrane protein